jgi:hypothetical protein
MYRDFLGVIKSRTASLRRGGAGLRLISLGHRPNETPQDYRNTANTITTISAGAHIQNGLCAILDGSVG